MHFLRQLWTQINRNDCSGLAAEMSYNWMLSLLPTLIFMLTLLGLFGVQSNSFKEIMVRLHQFMPSDALKLIHDSVKELIRASTGGLAIISLLGALWTASNGAITIEKALNRSYQCTDMQRNFWQQRVVALLIVLGLVFLLFVVSNLIVFGDLMFNAIQTYLRLPVWVLTLLAFLRWCIPIIGLVPVMGFIYWIAPDYKHTPTTKKVVWPGALTFVGVWLLISWLFSLYVTNLGTYNKIYGSMGVIIILMVWLYLTSFTLIIGGEVNAILTGCNQENPPERANNVSH
jgi:membrane protein